ncbi:zinc-ribbon domain-containing protein, partial [Enhygromyxa salina]|uniref:zinc-ribbon domain-containing protein n=1 Tax=Enhygromyxa salina TaxID=215803 RepID=UPI001C625B39
MIIACPECTSPFQVADGQIAALVQVECPTCSFRMILDFEAANDASLREAGMQMAQGFHDEASYRQAVGAGEVSYAEPKPGLRAVPEPTPAPKPAPTPRPAAAPQP